MMRTWALVILCAVVGTLPAVGLGKTITGLPFQRKIQMEGRSITVRYLLYLPPGYARDIRRKWPVILYLHGSTEKGSDLSIVRRNGLPAHLEKEKLFPFIVISPQLPLEQERWDPDAMKGLLDAVLPDLRADRDRLYLTGLSLGGNGVWRMAISYPDLFAAIAPIAGWGDASRVRVLKNVPVWAFHGAKDTNVLPRESVSMVEALRRDGGDVRLTLYPDLEHDCWTKTYDNTKLYAWFLQHHRPKQVTQAAIRKQHIPAR